MHLLYSLLIFCCLYAGNNTIVASAPPFSESSSTPHKEGSGYHTDDYSLDELRSKTPSDIFETANIALANQDYTSAIAAYKILRTVDPLGKYSEEAFVNMIQSYHDMEDSNNVILETNKFLALYPTSQLLEKVHYLNASVYVRPQARITGFLYRLFKFDKLDPAYCIDIDELKRAIQYFTEFLEQFPNGDYAEKARATIETIHQLMARREYYIAAFYFKSKNYIAAYNRITNILDAYPDIDKVLPKKYVTNLNKQYHATKQLLGLTSS